MFLWSLCFILLTTLSNKVYINISGFLILGLYLSLLENRAAVLFWTTTFFAALIYYAFSLFKKNKLINQLKLFIFKWNVSVFNLLNFIFNIFLFYFFWSENYTLPSHIKGTLLMPQ